VKVASVAGKQALHDPMSTSSEGAPFRHLRKAGHPHTPGGMGSAELLWACHALAGQLQIVGADIVEVLPTAIGSADITALVAARVVHEMLTGIATGRRGTGSGSRSATASSRREMR
jgi:arginase family enzyme